MGVGTIPFFTWGKALLLLRRRFEPRTSHTRSTASPAAAAAETKDVNPGANPNSPIPVA